MTDVDNKNECIVLLKQIASQDKLYMHANCTGSAMNITSCSNLYEGACFSNTSQYKVAVSGNTNNTYNHSENGTFLNTCRLLLV